MNLKTLVLTNEFPPHIYGGAGVHVDYLTRELSKLCQVDVRCFGEQQMEQENLVARGEKISGESYTAPKNLHSVFKALQANLNFNTRNVDADIVHLHTWYSHFGGILAKLNYGIPMVLTVHSLEPLRPWKREQLGGGYDFTSWVEKTAIEMADAVIAVSHNTRDDVQRHFSVDPHKIHVIPNGIDPNEYKPTENPELLRQYGIDPDRPFVLFVGRIARQKGIVHLVNAIQHIKPEFQVVLFAGAPDTPEIAQEMEAAVAHARENRDGIVWVQEMVNTEIKIAAYSHASVFCCPSIYEPFGIINLESLACGTPVVGSAVGGIKEIIHQGENGLLVPFDQNMDSTDFEPVNPGQFSWDLAQSINQVMSDVDLQRRMGEQGRRDAVEKYSWASIAEQVHQLYQQLIAKG